MHSAFQAAYVAALAAGLVPATYAKLRRNGWAGLHIAERLAQAPLPVQDGPLWVNAASVGELQAVSGLLESLCRRAPDLKVLFTHSAEAARPLAQTRLGLRAHALPLDFPSVINRFLNKAKPRMCMLVEQELWPNLINQTARRGIPVAVVNGRLSARTARKHARFHSFTHELFTNLALVCAQGRADAHRFQVLGAAQVCVTGNTKFDLHPDPVKVAAGKQLRAQINASQGDKPVLLLASTRPADAGSAEEELLLDALQSLQEQCTLLIVPRHPERFAVVGTMLERRNIQYITRTACTETTSVPSCILGNTMGEMDTYIAAADIVFVGASLIAKGGQNPVEAFAQGKAVIVGPHTENFAEVITTARRIGAVHQVADAAACATTAKSLFIDGNQRSAMGAAGRRLASQLYGAQERTMAQLEPLLATAGLLT